MSVVKEMCVLEHYMLATDFMYGVSGLGGAFNVKVDSLPDYSEDWESILLQNKTNWCASIRLSCNKTIDVFVDSGEQKLIPMSALKG